MTLEPGGRLGPYEVLGPLGAGGMGEVYRARDTRLGREVAVKVLPAGRAATPEARARFEREARAIANLHHPHVCTLYDVGREGEVEYLVMERLEGEPLSARLLRGPLPPAEALQLGVQIADALAAAHLAGIVHRDLKPANIMLTKAGAKLLDFGLARGAGVSGAPADLTQSPTVTRPLTTEGAIVGTFQYMSPEQLEGRDADARSDVFAFGATLYEAVTGRRAFEGRSQASLIAAILKEQPRPPSELQPLAPPALDRVVAQCLAKDPAERWQSASDLRRELAWISQGGSGVVAGAGVRPAAPARPARRGP
ncbi:MAG TPA: serine/threonine-protein kinase, partial [Candidatus Eisenbacteria bacterium]|nr:serine/threonine-protein kinase [Candidatus Eisenbacteria bacterium]